MFLRTEQGYVFWGFFDISPHLEGKSPKKPNHLEGGVNRHLQAKLAKYRSLRIIETTVSILTKFCTMIKTTELSSKHAYNSNVALGC